MSVGRNNVRPVIESVLEQFTNICLEGPLPSAAATGNLFVRRSPNTGKNSSSNGSCGK